LFVGEGEQHKQGERQAEGEAGFLLTTNTRLDPRTPRSCPGPKADI